MFCQKCGQQLDEGAKFCGNCGAPQNASPQTEQPQQNQQPVKRQPFPNNTVTNTAAIKQEEPSKFQQILTSGFVIYPLLLLFPPIGMAIMWFGNKTYSTKKKIILTVIFGLWLLYCVKSQKTETQTSSPSAQTQQTQQPAQQPTETQAATTTTRKNLGKKVDFWRAYNQEIKGLASEHLNFSYSKSDTGYIEYKNDTSERFIYVKQDTGFLSDDIASVRVELAQSKVKDEEMQAAFIVGCAALINVTSQDVTVEERNEILKKLHIVSQNILKSGTWRYTHNDIEYIFESETDAKLGMTLTAKIKGK